MLYEIYNIKITIHLNGEKEKTIIDEKSVDYVRVSTIMSDVFEEKYPLIVDNGYCPYEFADILDGIVSYDEPLKITANEEIGYAMVTIQGVA